MIGDVMVADARQKGLGVFAWRPIAAGEEITLDYRINALDGTTWPCSCGAPSCTGTLAGGFLGMPPDLRRAYLPHRPAFIRQAARSQ